MKKLQINISDLTKIPPFIAELLLDQKDLVKDGSFCKGDKIDGCWLQMSGNEEKLVGISKVLNDKGIRTNLIT